MLLQTEKSNLVAVYGAGGLSLRMGINSYLINKLAYPLPDGLPVIFHAVRRSVEAGIKDIALVTNGLDVYLKKLFQGFPEEVISQLESEGEKGQRVIDEAKRIQ